MTSKSLSLVLIFIGVVLEVVGDIYIKKWTIEKQNLLLVLGVVLYFVGSIFWIMCLKYEYLFRAISIFTILNLIIIVLAGIVIFNEHLTTANKIGVALGILSIILLETR